MSLSPKSPRNEHDLRIYTSGRTEPPCIHQHCYIAADPGVCIRIYVYAYVNRWVITYTCRILVIYV